MPTKKPKKPKGPANKPAEAPSTIPDGGSTVPTKNKKPKPKTLKAEAKAEKTVKTKGTVETSRPAKKEPGTVDSPSANTSLSQRQGAPVKRRVRTPGAVPQRTPAQRPPRGPSAPTGPGRRSTGSPRTGAPRTRPDVTVKAKQTSMGSFGYSGPLGGEVKAIGSARTRSTTRPVSRAGGPPATQPRAGVAPRANKTKSRSLSRSR